MSLAPRSVAFINLELPTQGRPQRNLGPGCMTVNRREPALHRLRETSYFVISEPEAKAKATQTRRPASGRAVQFVPRDRRLGAAVVFRHEAARGGLAVWS
jgi:hypothetical protein